MDLIFSRARRLQLLLPALVTGLLLFLASCGGGGGDGAVSPEPAPVPPAEVTVQGVITAAPYSGVDTTVNDPHAPLVGHSSFDEAQPVSNPVRLGGYVTLEPTGVPGDAFADQANPVDLYRVELSGGQQVTLVVNDFAAGEREVDLLLRDAQLLGSDGLPPVVDSSVGAVPAQQVTAPADGEYFLQVGAFAGGSKYVMVVGSMLSLLEMGYPEPLRPHLEMIPGEVIVTLREDPARRGLRTAGSTKSVQALSEQLGLQVRGGGPGREVLLRAPDLPASTRALGRLGLAGLPEAGARLQAPGPEAAAATLRLVRALSRHPAVARATPNYVQHLQLLPGDPHFDLQWPLSLINLPAAWELTTGLPETVVAVLDTGVFLAHPDLSTNLTTSGADGDGWNFVDCAPPEDCSSPDDPGDSVLPGSSSWHGTHVAGIVAAATDNGLGVAGTAWSVSIMPVRVCGQSGICSSFEVLQGVRYAAGLENDSGTVPQRRADVINLSLAGPATSSEAANLYQQVCDSGILVVAAAGNSNSAAPFYPASHPCVLSVAALDAQSARAPYSNFGPTVDLAAPGGDLRVDTIGDGFPDGILSTYVEDRNGTREPAYTFLQGTSMAAPHVAGILGLMRSLNQEITPAIVRSWLAGGEITEPLGGAAAGEHTSDFGYGRVDALLALQRAQAGAGPVLVATPTRLSFSGATGPLEFRLESAGGSLEVETVTVNADWVEVLPQEVDGAGLGTYQVQVEAAGLTPGAHLARVEARADNGVTVAVSVALQVPDPTPATTPEAGVHYVLLLDPEDFEPRFQTIVTPVAGRYDFELAAEPGSYYLVAGSDLDNDQSLCTPGEACGSYPQVDQLELIEVGADGLAGLDFSTSFGVDIGTMANIQTGQDLLPGVRRNADRSVIRGGQGPAVRPVPGLVAP